MWFFFTGGEIYHGSALNCTSHVKNKQNVYFYNYLRYNLNGLEIS